MKKILYCALLSLVGIVSYVISARETIVKQYTSADIQQNTIDSFQNNSTKEHPKGIEYREIRLSSNLLPYVNVAFSDTLILPYLVGKKAELAISVTPLCLNKTLENGNEEELLSSDLFRAFAVFPVVVGWNEEQVWNTEVFQTIEKKRRFFVDHHKLYYCGRTVISNDYDSFFLKVVGESETDEYPTISRTLYLVNVKHDSIMSISQFGSYNWFAEYESYSSTTLDKNGKYKHCRVMNWLDDNGNSDCKKDSIVFMFDKVGRIISPDY